MRKCFLFLCVICSCFLLSACGNTMGNLPYVLKEYVSVQNKNIENVDLEKYLPPNNKLVTYKFTLSEKSEKFIQAYYCYTSTNNKSSRKFTGVSGLDALANLAGGEYRSEGRIEYDAAEKCVKETFINGSGKLIKDGKVIIPAIGKKEVFGDCTLETLPILFSVTLDKKEYKDCIATQEIVEDEGKKVYIVTYYAPNIGKVLTVSTGHSKDNKFVVEEILEQIHFINSDWYGNGAIYWRTDGAVQAWIVNSTEDKRLKVFFSGVGEFFLESDIPEVWNKDGIGKIHRYKYRHSQNLFGLLFDYIPDKNIIAITVVPNKFKPRKDYGGMFEYSYELTQTAIKDGRMGRFNPDKQNDFSGHYTGEDKGTLDIRFLGNNEYLVDFFRYRIYGFNGAKAKAKDGKLYFENKSSTGEIIDRGYIKRSDENHMILVIEYSKNGYVNGKTYFYEK